MLNLLLEVSTLSSLLFIILIKMEINIFQIVARPSVGHVIKGSCGFSYGKSGSCLVWFPWFLCKWRYNASNLSPELTRAHQLEVTRIFEWKFVVVTHYPGKITITITIIW